MTGPIMIGKDKDAAKGALVAYTGPDAVGVVPAGREGEALVADPAAAAGVRWGKVDSFVGIPIFETLAEAQAWEAAHPGKTALTLEPSTPDTTAPSWNASLSVGTPTDKAVVVTASALATDDRAVAGYEVTYNGTTWSAITPTGKSFTLTGSPATTYSSTRLRAVDAAGNASTPLSVPSYTMAETPVGPSLPWMPAGAQVVLSDTFSGGDRTSFTGYVPDNALGGTLTPTPYLSVEGAFRIEGGNLVTTATGRFLYDVGANAGSAWYISYRMAELPIEGTGTVSFRSRAGISQTAGGASAVISSAETTGYEHGLLVRPDGTAETFRDGKSTGTQTTTFTGPYAGLISGNVTRAVVSQIVIAEVPA